MNIELPKLNGITPTLESTALKLMEEAGELAQAIGKHRGLSGEQTCNNCSRENWIADDGRSPCFHPTGWGSGCAGFDYNPSRDYRNIASELLDVAQVAVTMMYVLQEQHGIDVGAAMEEHMAKLRRKGYLCDEA